MSRLLTKLDEVIKLQEVEDKLDLGGKRTWWVKIARKVIKPCAPSQ